MTAVQNETVAPQAEEAVEAQAEEVFQLARTKYVATAAGEVDWDAMVSKLQTGTFAYKGQQREATVCGWCDKKLFTIYREQIIQHLEGCPQAEWDLLNQRITTAAEHAPKGMQRQRAGQVAKLKEIGKHEFPSTWGERKVALGRIQLWREYTAEQGF